MGSHVEGLEKWFSERPMWLQDAARRLLDNNGLEEADQCELYELCKLEAKIAFGESAEIGFTPIGEGSLIGEEEGEKVEIRSISNVKGVNALNPKKPIEFKNNLSIVYGENGSGKSGYTRLLKQACGAKNITPVLSNVFSETPMTQECDIEIDQSGVSQTINWSVAHGINDKLSSVELYDSDCGSVYVTKENELAYEPWLLRFLTNLISLSDGLSKKLDIDLKALVSSFPQVPSEYTNTKPITWFQTIRHDTTLANLDNNCQWTEQHEKSLTTLVKRLNVLDPAAEAVKSRRYKEQVDKLVKGFKNWEEKLSTEACESYLAKKKDAYQKKNASQKYAKSIFEASPLTGVGDEIWAFMWEKARNYSEQLAYPESGFPNTEESSLCVLCQQPLDDEAKKRLSGFESFIKGELESSAKKSMLDFSGLEKKIIDYPNKELIETIAKAANIDDELFGRVIQLRHSIELTAKELVASEIDKTYIPKIDFSLIEILDDKSRKLENIATKFDADAKKIDRKNLLSQKNELAAKKWLSENKSSVLTELTLLVEKEKLNQAKRLTKTSALSTKKSNLAEELVSEEYIARFADEISKLGANRIQVKLEKARASKGRIYFRLALTGSKSKVKVGDVLSEGEFRVVSLAAFLADVEGRSDQSTFIFDDPISSLDQSYEEKVANRLVDLSKSRQVIVFTHRLSLLSSLEEASKKQDDVTKSVIGLYREPWGTGEPGLPPMHSQKTKAAINTLISKLAEGKKIYEEEGTDKYSWWAKSFCSNTRITIERVIELDLLADVVQRFRRPITTQGKLDKVAKIRPKDCSYIDELMSKYSTYEHAQPNESPAVTPLPDELERDLNSLKSWRDEFTGREK